MEIYIEIVEREMDDEEQSKEYFWRFVAKRRIIPLAVSPVAYAIKSSCKRQALKSFKLLNAWPQKEYAHIPREPNVVFVRE